jgi:hypothetical protein
MTTLRWHAAVLVQGHGVASGKAVSPYPKGTIEMQLPFFAALGLDLSSYWPGTLNLSLSPFELCLSHPDYLFSHLRWTHLHPPETFSFWKIRLRRVGIYPIDVPGLIYWPHPETKSRHWQKRSTLEILAPYIDHVSLNQQFELGVNPATIQVLSS